MRAYVQVRRKKKLQRVFMYGAFVLSLAIFVFSFNAVRGVYGTYVESRTVRTEREASYTALLEKQAELQTELHAIETPRGEEEEIRERFRVALPDERMAIIVRDEEDLLLSAQVIQATNSSFWEKLLGWFGI